MSREPCSRYFIAAALITSAACMGPSRARPTSPARVRESLTVLTAEEIDRSGIWTGYEALECFRTTKAVRARGCGRTDECPIYIDGVRVSGIEVLRGVSSLMIQEIRWLASTEATTRFGTGHSAGAILVITKAGR